MSVSLQARIDRQPFAEAIAAWQARFRNQVPTATWRDLRRGAHDRAFTVAGALKADLLSDLAAAVDRGIREGAGIDQFRKDFDAIVAKHGWSYRGGRDWRIRTIFNTNMLVSQAAGRLAQLRDPQLLKLKPYWMYRHSGSELPRLKHKAWDGMALSADHPWFRTHYPPNGWGCRCSVIAVSKRDIERLGGRLVDAPDMSTDGIDEGWDYMPGDSVNRELSKLVAKKAEALPEPLARSLVAREVAEHFPAFLNDPVGEFPLAVLSAVLQRIGAKKQVAMISADTARKQLARHPELTLDDYRAAQAVIDDPDEVIQDDENAAVFVQEHEGIVLVVKTTRTGQGLFVTSLRRLSSSEAERDRELRRLRKQDRT